MKSATTIINRFMGGIDVDYASRFVDREALSPLFPNGIPAYTVIGSIHFSFRVNGDGKKILTCIRKVNPQN